jgi:hypothetical protein
LLLNVLCLLLILATGAMWLRSYFVGDTLYLDRWSLDGVKSWNSGYWFVSQHGSIRVGHRSQQAMQRPESVAEIQRLVDQSPSLVWSKNDPLALTAYPNASFSFLGIEVSSLPAPPAFVADGVTGRWTDIRFPHGLLCLVLALPATWLLIRTYRTRRPPPRPLPHLRLRPPRLPQSLPRMRHRRHPPTRVARIVGTVLAECPPNPDPAQNRCFSLFNPSRSRSDNYISRPP